MKKTVYLVFYDTDLVAYSAQPGDWDSYHSFLGVFGSEKRARDYIEDLAFHKNGDDYEVMLNEKDRIEIKNVHDDVISYYFQAMDVEFSDEEEKDA